MESRVWRRRGRFGILGGALIALVLVLVPTAASASTIGLDGRDLEIEGDPDGDAITVSTDGTTITVTDTGAGGASQGSGCASANATTVTCPANTPDGPVDRFDVILDDGVDSFTNQNLVTRQGFISARTVICCDTASGSKTINGGPGTQLISGGTDDDVLNGGEGTDSLEDGSFSFSVEPTGGNDVIDGGPGEDTADYFRDAGVSITLDGVANDGGPGEADNVLAENVITGNGDDTVIGDATANVITTNGGADLANGMGGNDTLAGDPFSSLIQARGGGGVPGDDTLIAGSGKDDLSCGLGYDQAIHDSDDHVAATCERVGASVRGDSAALRGKKKNKFKVSLSCPESEGVPCTGKLKIRAAGKKLGNGKFSVQAGKTKNGSARLSKKGLKAVRKAGGKLTVTVRALTTEPAGVTEDVGRIFVHR